MRQENLRGMQVEARERGFISLHQSHLADRCGRLQLMHRRWSLAPSEPLHAFGNRTRGHEHDFLAHLTKRRDFLGPARDRCVVDAAAVVGHEAGTDFDHEPARGGDHRNDCRRIHSVTVVVAATGCFCSHSKIA